MSLPTKQLHIRFPEELLAKINSIVDGLYVDRSEFIRQAVIEKVRQYEDAPAPPPQKMMLMTDKQLDELAEIVRMERHRRNIRYWPRALK